MNIKRMTTISIIVTAMGLILAAVGVSFFRHFSALKTENSFNEASFEREELKKKMNNEFEKTINEMVVHRDSLNEKVESEALSIISELKQKSYEANNALELLKNETNLAAENISNEVKKLKEITEQDLAKIAYPLPNNIIVDDLKLYIYKHMLLKYVQCLKLIYICIWHHILLNYIYISICS